MHQQARCLLHWVPNLLFVDLATALLPFVAGVYALVILVPLYLLSLVAMILAVIKIIKGFTGSTEPVDELPPDETINDVSWFLDTLRGDLRAKALPCTTIDVRPRHEALGEWGSAGKVTQVCFSFEMHLADRTMARVTLGHQVKRKVKSRNKRRGRLLIAKDVVREVVRVPFRPPSGQSFDERWQQIIMSHPPRVPGMMLTGEGVRPDHASFVFGSQAYRTSTRAFSSLAPSTPITARTKAPTLLLALIGSYKSLTTAKRVATRA